MVPSKLEQCPPDKYVVLLGAEVVLSPEEWLELVDYDVVQDVDRSIGVPPGNVYLMRKVNE